MTDLSLVRTSEHMAMGMAWWWVGGCACAEQTLHLQSSSSSLHGLASCCWWRECPLDCRGRASMQHDRTGPTLLSLSLTSLTHSCRWCCHRLLAAAGVMSSVCTLTARPHHLPLLFDRTTIASLSLSIAPVRPRRAAPGRLLIMVRHCWGSEHSRRLVFQGHAW